MPSGITSKKRGFIVDEIVYPSTLTNGKTRDEIVHLLQKRLDEARFQHCLRVEKTARALARLHHEDVDRAGLAGLLHDYAKQIPVADYRQLIETGPYDPELLVFGRGVWHGVVGIAYIEREVGITDKLVLQAIARHTTGDPDMTPLDEIIFLADFIEPARTLDSEKQARKAAQTDLTEATLIELSSTLTYLVGARKLIFPKTLETYNALLQRSESN